MFLRTQEHFSKNLATKLISWYSFVVGSDANKRSNYSPEIIKALMEWLTENIAYPYPTSQQREHLCESTGLNRRQLRMWL
mmetsp:Transcript_18780/g.18444  ORF Transcript_18780/g.18444 Transcript_18780/m.18444 type:complete len:80 (-) Transcript_18780:305-544(-)